MDAKRTMRAEVLARRERLGDEARADLSAKITANLTSLPEYRSSKVVLAYSSFGSELDTRPFLRAVLADGKTLVLPRIVREEKRLSLHAVENLGRDLVPGVWSILEPDENLPRLHISDVDFVLTPGVAFDRKGGRLGQGGGFYDRLLDEHRPLLVAGAFGVQIVDEVPGEPHDVCVDLIVSESGEVLTPETGSR